ncbi:lytic transglycosylase, partial [Citrobacter amalonaticus]|nr:lytic transglycosylase [Citrobacter amalonaticus]MEB0643747.1 lytic transglycosylase [Citrobacter amalonaticus]
VIETKTPESRIGGELEITPDVLTPNGLGYAVMVRKKDKDGVETVQPFYNKYGRPVRWEPKLEEWEPYKKMQQEREQRDQEEITRGQAIRGFKDKHRALDEQYKRLHNERINSVPEFIYGGGTN